MDLSDYSDLGHRMVMGASGARHGPVVESFGQVAGGRLSDSSLCLRTTVARSSTDAFSARSRALVSSSALMVVQSFQVMLSGGEYGGWAAFHALSLKGMAKPRTPSHRMPAREM